MENAERGDIYERVTQQIIEAIEKGAGKTVMPWHGNSGMPVNVASGSFYRGINVPVLWATAQEKGYQSPVFGTFKQWLEKGAQVRKGEKSATVVFWKFFEGKKAEGEDAGDDEEKGRRAMARAYHVFNAAQVDGYTPPSPPAPLPPDQRIPHAEAFFANLGATLKHEGVRAFYRPSTDEIYMPPFELFKDAPSYYSVNAHEHFHWSGAEKRLARDLKNRFGSEAYAAEEISAELAAAMTCATLGIASQPRQDSAAYVENWLKVLKSDKRAIFSAASHAQRGVDLFHSMQPRQAIETAEAAETVAASSLPDSPVGFAGREATRRTGGFSQHRR